MMRDPYTNTQIQFHRTDPTGRWSPISGTAERDPAWVSVLGGIVAGGLIALMFYFSL